MNDKNEETNTISQDLEQLDTVLAGIIKHLDPDSRSQVNRLTAEIVLAMNKYEPLISTMALAMATQINTKKTEGRW